MAPAGPPEAAAHRRLTATPDAAGTVPCMCRYSAAVHPVPTSLVCLTCRIAVSQIPFRGPGPTCGRCAGPLIDAGRDFAAPPRRDVRQWRKVALLLEAGVRFDSCGCAGPGRRPGTLADAKMWQRDVARRDQASQTMRSGDARARRLARVAHDQSARSSDALVGRP